MQNQETDNKYLGPNCALACTAVSPHAKLFKLKRKPRAPFTESVLMSACLSPADGAGGTLWGAHGFGGPSFGGSGAVSSFRP